jgi:hypothetical protein
VLALLTPPPAVGTALPITLPGRGKPFTGRTLEAEDVCLVNSFQFLGPNNVAAKVSFKLRGDALMGRERNGVFLSL